MEYRYGIEQDADLGYTVQTQTTVLLDETGAETGSYKKTFTDALGWTYKMETPAANGRTAVTRYYHNALNQLEREEDPDGMSILYAYNTEGEREVTALDVDDHKTIDYDGTDRITRVQGSYTTRTEDSDSYIIQRQTTEVWEVDDQDSAKIISRVDRSLGDLPGSDTGSFVRSTVYRQTTTRKSLIERSSAKVTTTTTLPDSSYQVDVMVNGVQESITRYDGNNDILFQQIYSYDNEDENILRINRKCKCDC